MAETGRKRRDDLEDQLGGPVYAEAPLPPFMFSGDQFLLVCFRFDPKALRPFLPPGLTLFEPATANLYIFRNSPAGIGIRSGTAAFIGISVNEYPSPDTAEAGFMPLGVMSGQGLDLVRRHYAAFVEGHAELEEAEGLMTGRVFIAGRHVLTAVIRGTGEIRDDTSASDRYFGWNGAGDLVTSVITGVGLSQAAEVLALTFTPEAPPLWQALTPQGVVFGLRIPRFVFSWSAPDPWLPESAADLSASRAALMEIFDRQDRACVLVSGSGRIVLANAAARRLLGQYGLVRQGQLRLAPGQDRDRLAAALAEIARAGAASLPAPFLVGQGAQGLVLQLVPAAPALAGPDTALVVLTDLAQRAVSRDTGLLQLLGLTRGEARIAAAVGAGLPPREAALRLGLAESTVRSSLKTVFDKLGVKRQAELVQLVARLEAR